LPASKNDRRTLSHPFMLREPHYELVGEPSTSTDESPFALNPASGKAIERDLVQNYRIIRFINTLWSFLHGMLHPSAVIGRQAFTNDLYLILIIGRILHSSHVNRNGVNNPWTHTAPSQGEGVWTCNLLGLHPGFYIPECFFLLLFP